MWWQCCILEKKNQRLLKPDLVIGQQTCSSGYQPPDRDVDDDVAGYLGISRIYYKVLNHFYWPGLRGDTKLYCKTSHSCQLMGKPIKKPPVAPLKPIPVMEEPFSCIIVDFLVPLPKTRSGNHYLLTVMCASTWYPDAIPLRTIKAPNIVKLLVKFFTFIRLPKVVQSDHGSNFMSGLFQRIIFLLGIQQVKSTAYHPQTHGHLRLSPNSEEHNESLLYHRRNRLWWSDSTSVCC